MWDGKRRFGKPRSNAERRRRHKRLYGTSKLPPRGTGLRNLEGMSVHPVEQKRTRKEIHIGH